jgi:hypothetical protein
MYGFPKQNVKALTVHVTIPKCISNDSVTQVVIQILEKPVARNGNKCHVPNQTSPSSQTKRKTFWFEENWQVVPYILQ